MNVVGIDASTHALDYVKLGMDDDRAEWTRVEAGANTRGWDRVQGYRGRGILDRKGNAISGAIRGSWWDDVILAAVEQPMGRGDSPLIISIAVGIAVAHIPPRIPVLRLNPREWRKACGMKGNASKADVVGWVMNARIYNRDPTPKTCPTSWPQDACDAYAIAWAARALNEQQEAA